MAETIKRGTLLEPETVTSIFFNSKGSFLPCKA